MLERILQHPVGSSAIVLPPAFLPPDPKCSNGSIGPPDPRLRLDGRDWGEAHLADSFLLRWLLPLLDPAFPSVPPPTPPVLPSYPAALGPATSPASMSVHSSFAELLCFFKVDLLIHCDCTVECVIR